MMESYNKNDYEVFGEWVWKCKKHDYSLWSMRNVYLDYMAFANKGMDLLVLIKNLKGHVDDPAWEPCGNVKGLSMEDINAGMKAAGFKSITVPDKEPMYYVHLPRMGCNTSVKMYQVIDDDLLNRWVSQCKRSKTPVSVHDAYINYMVSVNQDMDPQVVTDLCNLKNFVSNWIPRGDMKMRGVSKHQFIDKMEKNGFMRTYMSSNVYNVSNVFHITLPQRAD